MNKDDFNVRKSISSLTKKKTQSKGQGKDRRKKPADGPREVGNSQGPRRVSPFPGIPVIRQTVIAVVVCCALFLAVGFALFSATQREINDLKNDLKAYTTDGVVSAGFVDETVGLCLEAVGARVDFMQTVMDKASDGTMSNSDFQWFGSELTAVKAEATTLVQILDEVDAGEAAEKTFNDEIQKPLSALETAYNELEVSDDDVASTNLGDDGAATDTGSFKLQTGVKGALKWIVILILLIVLALLSFLFRKKIGGLGHRLFGKKGVKKEKQGKRSKSRNPEEYIAVDHDAKDAAEVAASEIPQAHQEGKTQKPSFAFEEQPQEMAAKPSAEEVEGDPLDRLAPSFRVMASLEKAKAAPAADTPPPPSRSVPEEDLMDFDPGVEGQAEIDDDEDPLFSKGEEN
ncbi:MAG TPA: hypothetical protein PKD52_07880 [Clostridiales bacterium]|nr:hypothetical protein [Clostridiales bacterium]